MPVFAFDRTVSRLLEMQSEPYKMTVQASLLQSGDQGCGYRHLMAACALTPFDSKVRKLLPSTFSIYLYRTLLFFFLHGLYTVDLSLTHMLFHRQHSPMPHHSHSLSM